MEFLVGKWLGGQLVLHLRSGAFFVLRDSGGGRSASGSIDRRRGGGQLARALWGCLPLRFLQWIKFGVVSAITIFIGSFSNTNLYTIIVAFFVLVVCQLQYIAREAYAEMASGLTRWFVALIAWVFPNFQLFNVSDQMVLLSNEGLPPDTTIRIIGYGFFYMAVFLSLAFWHFRRRQF